MIAGRDPVTVSLFNRLKALEDKMEHLERLQQQAVVGTKSYTIASGKIQVTGVHKVQLAIVDTESAAGTDDLAEINTSTMPVGGLLIINAADSTHTVVVKDNSTLFLSGDFSLDNIADSILLVYLGSNSWQQLSRSDNAA
jgi:hypothetical protein